MDWNTSRGEYARAARARVLQSIYDESYRISSIDYIKRFMADLFYRV